MTEKRYEQLKTEDEFKNLIRPLSREEYAQLEANLVADGCRDPIITWNGVIIDGHNRYEICNRLHIPYAVQKMNFDGREEVIIWICVNQLGRRNIADEARRYLIGRQYEAEKMVGFNRNASGRNQYTNALNAKAPHAPNEVSGQDAKETYLRTAARIGDEYHISSVAVQKYAKYSKALDVLGKKMPEIVPKVLSGSYKISHDNIVALSEMDDEEVKELSVKIGLGTVPAIRYSESRRDLSGAPEKQNLSKLTTLPAIKMTPKYDPDSLVNGLALTIPSWVSSIERTRTAGDMRLVSRKAKKRLREVLERLQCKIQALLNKMEDEF